MKKTLIFPATMLVLASCAPKEKEKIIEKQTIIQQEFAQVKEAPSEVEEKNATYHIEMRKGFLRSEFLLSTSGIQILPAPQGNSFANKIVYFEIKDDILYLFESLKGKLVTDSIKTKLLLAEFPIVAKTKKTITFDFKEGLKHILFKGSNFTSERSQEVVEDNYIEITTNYIEKVELRKNHLLIDQTFRYNDTKKNESGVYQLKFAITPYKKNPGFIPVETNSQKQVGYFETHPILTAPTGHKAINIVKFDTRKPVTYSLTDNIPQEYKQAVIDGILYWNTVFGKEVIKVDTLPKGISVHEPGYNIVQWLDYDSAGFAYAQLQADPLTGENLQSHVYMTSVFGLGHYRNARRIYNKIKTKNKKIKPVNFQFSGLEKNDICQHHSHEHEVKAFEKIFNTLEGSKFNHSQEEKEKIYKRYAQDYVRQVVAHEIGHTLGLRHNFAGSLQNNLSPKEFEKESESYFITGQLNKDVNLTGTVMDYTPGMMSSMIGAHIRLKRPGLSYDKQAIRWGYLREGNPMNFDLFCTDGDRAQKYTDCKVWDSFSNAFESAQYDKEDTPKSIASKLNRMFSFLNRGLNKTKEEEIQKLQMDPLKDASNLIKFGHLPLFDALKSKSEFIKIKKSLKDRTSLAPEIYKQLTTEYKEKEISKLGGLSKVLLSPLSIETTSGRIAYIDLVEKAFIKGFEKKYAHIAPRVKELAKKKVNRYLTALEKEYVRIYSKMLLNFKVDHEDKQYTKDLEQIITALLFEESSHNLGQLNGQNIMKFYFDYKETRSTLIQLVSKSPFFKTPSTNRIIKKIKERISTKHKEYMKTVLGDLNAQELNDELYDWYINETKLFRSL